MDKAVRFRLLTPTMGPSLRSAVVLVTATALLMFSPSPARSAAPADSGSVSAQAPDGLLVLRVQRALAGLGLYRGTADGILDRATADAVRAHQRAAGLPADGRITEELAAALAQRANASALAIRLETARRADKEAARRALQSHEATRRLVDPGVGEPADPIRDHASCHRQPTVRCLVADALDSARAVPREEMRDWAYGEIAAVQARADLIADAFATLALMTDPRLMLTGLRSVAEAEAEAGRWDAALETARIIPETVVRAEARAAIATARSRRGLDPGPVLALLLQDIDALEDPLKRVTLRVAVASIAAETGEADAARRHLDLAEAAARDQRDAEVRAAGLRHVALAYARMREPERAVSVIDHVADAGARIPVLAALAVAEAENGHAGRAMDAADAIREDRYRAAALGDVAVAAAAAGDREKAEAILVKALGTADSVRSPYARAYAVSQVALAALRIVGHHPGSRRAEAEAIARRIGDDRLRASVLWSIAAQRRHGGDVAGAEILAFEAERAARSIPSRLSQAWLFGDAVEVHAALGLVEAAAKAFSDGLAIAASIEVGWARARALARMAGALSTLTAAQVSAGR